MDVFEIDAFGEDTGAQVLADFVFVPGEQLKYGESPVIGSIEQENWMRVWMFCVCRLILLCASDVRLQEISGEGVSGPPYMPPAYFTRRGFFSQTTKKDFPHGLRVKLT